MSPYDDPAVTPGEIADYLDKLRLETTPPPQPATATPAMPELLPCPFCGATPEIQPAHRHGFFVSCENPHCAVSPETTFDAETPEQAAERWNARPTPQAA